MVNERRSNEKNKEIVDIVVEIVAEKSEEELASGKKMADWRSLFALSTEQAMSYFSPQKLNGKVVVSPPKDVFEERESCWRTL